jgi:site-specific DNA-methyltransferase (adenine-specific)
MSEQFRDNDANVTIHWGNCLDVLRGMEDESVDSVVTDPPYGLGNTDPSYIVDALQMWAGGDRDHIPAGKGFMGKQWDAFVPPPAVWDECYRVLKPGGHMLVFAGSRTIDLMGLSVRFAGFEIRDSITWIYAQGFPKSLDVSKALDKMAGVEFKEEPASGVGFMNAEGEGGYNVTKNKLTRVGESTDDAVKWKGWGTALKPASEPILVARKPLSEKNVALNVLKHGTGAINIDASRIGNEERTYKGMSANVPDVGTFRDDAWVPKDIEVTVSGRFPTNVLFQHADECVLVGEAEDSYVINQTEDWTGFGQVERPDYKSSGQTAKIEVYECVEGCPVAELDKQSGITKSSSATFKAEAYEERETSTPFTRGDFVGRGDTGGASRFFFVAKANKKDRNEGLGNSELEEKGKVFNGKSDTGAGKAEGSVEDKFSTAPQKNFHPTVKPTSLMKYLVEMVTPAGGVVLDPFTGSGSTGKAAVQAGVGFVGIEMTEEYLPIIIGRVKHEIEKNADTLF